MKTELKQISRLAAACMVAACATVIVPATLNVVSNGQYGFMASAHAEESGEGEEGGKKGGKDVKGGHGEDKGHGGEKGQKDVLTKGPNNSKGDYEASGQGPRGSKGDADDRSKPPVWAKEGVTVELGRLNVVRAPDSVRDRQLAEALKNDPALFAVYSWTIAKFTADLTDDTARVDAPLMNLSLYEAFVTEYAKNPSATSVVVSSVDKETKLPVSYTFDLSGGATATSVLGIMLGTATDKDVAKIGGVTTEVVTSVNKIMGLTDEFTAAGIDPAAVGTAAESVRAKISTVHGE
jgi:hypothetical protein